MNEFDRLVNNLNEGKLSLNQIQIAIRAHIQQRQNFPENIKNILCGQAAKGGSGGGLIGEMFSPIKNVIGAVELAYLRGKQNKKT